jgi:hypothetical protein
MLPHVGVRTRHHASEFGQTPFDAGNCSLEDDRGLLERAALTNQSLQVTIILL